MPDSTVNFARLETVPPFDFASETALNSPLTSFGLPEELGIPSSVLDGLRKSSDPHIVFAEFDHRGYGVVTVKKNELLGEFKKASTTQQPNGTISSLAKFKVESGKPQLQQV